MKTANNDDIKCTFISPLTDKVLLLVVVVVVVVVVVITGCLMI